MFAIEQLTTGQQMYEMYEIKGHRKISQGENTHIIPTHISSNCLKYIIPTYMCINNANHYTVLNINLKIIN